MTQPIQPKLDDPSWPQNPPQYLPIANYWNLASTWFKYQHPRDSRLAMAGRFRLTGLRRETPPYPLIDPQDSNRKLEREEGEK
jgi:hypothetical protein